MIANSMNPGKKKEEGGKKKKNLKMNTATSQNVEFSYTGLKNSLQSSKTTPG
jgi:tRNA A37 threonylcarbamoyltransferase TsaD